MARKKVFAALSGGVDSSVAAALLKKRGFNVFGVHIRGYNLDGCGGKEALDARRVAQHLKIPFYVFDFEEEYKKRVVDYMVDGYRRGLTPNPDVMCNKEIKFGLFLEKALELGTDYVATGHYVRLSRRPGYSLFIAQDKNKDQSYFLWTVTQKQLKHCLFPIGAYTKPQVRTMAKKIGLPTAGKKDSQGICFLGKVALQEFLGSYLPPERGAVLNTAGKTIGEHQGVFYYTVGQRHGLGTGGAAGPLYVVEKNVKNNTLIAAEGGSPAIYEKEVVLTDVNFLNPQVISLIRVNNGIKIQARLRYRQPLAPATLKFTSSQNVNLNLIFDEPQKFVAPGQSAVFYSGRGGLLGGGVIV